MRAARAAAKAMTTSQYPSADSLMMMPHSREVLHIRRLGGATGFARAVHFKRIRVVVSIEPG